MVEQRLYNILQEDIPVSTTQSRLDRPHQTQEEGEEDINTNAWSSIEVNSGGGGTTPALDGVVVSGDAQLGHVLVTFLSNGECPLCFDSFRYVADIYISQMTR